MILDMIQGCRYLQRLTDRWLFSKNSTTRLKGLKSWHRADLLWNCSIDVTNTKGSYLYPGSNTTPSRPRLQHLLPNGVMSVSHPSSIHPFFIFKPRHYAFSNAFLFQAWNSSSAEWWRTPDRRRLYRMLWGKPLAEWCSPAKLSPQVGLFPVPIFSVNKVVRPGCDGWLLSICQGFIFRGKGGDIWFCLRYCLQVEEWEAHRCHTSDSHW
jgi:hypothetical protein